MATAYDVLGIVGGVLHDGSLPDRWSEAELLRWASDAQREVVKHVPEAATVTEVFNTWAYGQPQQRIEPDQCYKLVRVEANAVTRESDISSSVTPDDEWTDLGVLTYGAGASFFAVQTQTLTYTPPPTASVARDSMTVFLFLSNGDDGNRPAISDPTWAGILMGIDQLYAASPGEPVGDVPGHVIGNVAAPWPYQAPVAPYTLSVPVCTFGNPTTIRVFARTFSNVASIATGFPVSGGYGVMHVLQTRIDSIPADNLIMEMNGYGWVDYMTPADYEIHVLSVSAESLAPPATLGNVLPAPTPKFSIAHTNGSPPSGIRLVTSYTGTNSYLAVYDRQPTSTDTDYVTGVRVTDAAVVNSHAAYFRLILNGVYDVTTSTVFGEKVRLVQRDVIDSFAALWQRQVGAGSAESYFKVWAPDSVDPCAFSIYPPPRVGDSAWITYVRNPPELVNGTDELVVSAVYTDAMADYILFRAYSKRSRVYSPEAAAAALARFGAQLKLSREVLNSIAAYAQRPSSDGPVTP